MKKLLTMAAMMAAGSLFAGTYTWTGAAGDGLWFTAGNWSFDDGAGVVTSPAAKAPTASCSDDIVIANGDTVEYVPGGDWVPSGTVTIGGGSKLFQSGGLAWPNIQGTLVLDGGTYDPGTAGRLRIYGTLIMRNHAVIGTAPEYEFGSSAVFEIGTGCSFSFTTKGSGQKLVLNGGTVNVSGAFTTNPDDEYAGGLLTVGGETISTAGTVFSAGTLIFNGEFRPRNGTVFEGADVTVGLFSPNTANTVFTLRGGSVKLASTSNDGYWRAETSTYMDIPANSTGALIVPYAYDAETSATTIYDRYFKGTTPYIRIAGAPVESLDAFKEMVVLSDAGQGEYGGATVSYTRIELVPPESGTPIFNSRSATVSVADEVASVTFTAKMDDAGVPEATLTLVYGTVDGGTEAKDAWQNQVVVSNPGSGGTVEKTISGFTGAMRYWYAFVAENETATTWTMPESILIPPTDPNEVLWVGTSNSTDSRVAENWLPARVPTATDTVVVLAPAAISTSLNWYSDTGAGTVAGWRQPEGFAAYPVYFHTKAEVPLAIAGDAELLSGTWTHSGPSATPETMLNIRVEGDLTVGAGASIQAGTAETGTDFRSRGYQRATGPGYQRLAGGSFAGEGGHITNTTGFVSYGSILDPLSYGSGGWGDGSQYAGGGIIKLSVGGTLTVDGCICSRGFGYALWGDFVGGAGSGGSINITAATMTGDGSIDANGGNNGGYGPGSGGRVKISLTGTDATFESFAGTIEAVGGGMQNATDTAAYDVSPAAAGTICLQTPEAAPVIKVYNVFRYGGVDTEWRVANGDAIPSATHLPAMIDGDERMALKPTQWELSGRGALRLTADVTIGSLDLVSDDGTQKVYLDGYTLTTSSLTVNGFSIDGEKTAEELNELLGAAIFEGEGKVFIPRCFLLLFR